jgi:iron complex outermembrane receptor protein
VRQWGGFGTLEVVAAASAPVDDANQNRVRGYQVVNLRMGSNHPFGRSRISPLIGAYNVFDRKYAGSVVVNAAGGKYYEPAPGRSFQVGLTAAFGARE